MNAAIPIVYIFFGTPREAQMWALENDVDFDDLVLAIHPSQLEGRRARPKVVYGNTWNERMAATSQSLPQLYETVAVMEMLYGKAP